MSWLILLLAALFEVIWAVGLKYTDGFSRLWPTLGTITALMISFGLLGIAVKTLPIGTAYAVWVGIGTVGTALLGIFLFAESVSPIKIISLSLICVGIIGLKLAHN